MNSFYNNGYQETIQKGLSAVRSFRSGISTGAGSRNEQIERLKKEIESANAIVIGAGAGLSTAAGLTYSGERFEKYFGDFAARFDIQDMYSGGFIHSQMRKRAGHGGQGISTITVISIRRRMFMENCWHWFRIKTTSSLPQMLIINSRELVLIKSVCFIHREIMACFKA